MKNRSGDVSYCGVDKNKIINASPILNKINLKHFYNWLTERYEIHVKKDIKRLSKPWTNDPVLQKYKFCNVRREHDRESRWLIKNIVNSGLSYENKLLNIILFRLINKSETIKIFGLIDFNELNLDNLRYKLENFARQNRNYVYFSNAFFMSGPKTAANKIFRHENNMVIKMMLLVKKYRDMGLIEKINMAKSQKDVFNETNKALKHEFSKTTKHLQSKILSQGSLENLNEGEMKVRGPHKCN